MEYTNAVQNATSKSSISDRPYVKGCVSGSITCTQKRAIEFKTLAEATDLSDMDHLTFQHLAQMLEKFHASFKEFHFGMLDLIDKVEQDDEQAVLDKTRQQGR